MAPSEKFLLLMLLEKMNVYHFKNRINFHTISTETFKQYQKRIGLKTRNGIHLVETNNNNNNTSIV